jgi:hypothetical protein
MQAWQLNDATALAAMPSRRLERLVSAGRSTARWIVYFAISFALTAGVLILAHV